VTIHNDKQFLLRLIPQIRSFLREELKLELHQKKLYLQHYSKGVEFLGVVIKGGVLLSGKRMKSGLYRTIQSHNIKSESNKGVSDEGLCDFSDSINSYWGLMRHHSSYNLRRISAKRFSKHINRVVNYPCYCKINIKKRWRIRYSDLYLGD